MPDTLHVFAVSDSVGETAERIAMASLTQFEVERNVTRFSRVRKLEQIDTILDKAIAEKALIVYTIVRPVLVEAIENGAREKGVTVINAMAPLMDAIRERTGLKPYNIAGLSHKKDDNYFNRMEAIEWTLEHDNGKNLDDYHEADLIILGLPKTSKTPLCMHLATNLGLKVANYNLGFDTVLPHQIADLKGKVPLVGLTLDYDSLLELRKEGFTRDELPPDINSLEDLVAEEQETAYRIYARLKCFVIDVTMSDIEEVGHRITQKFKLPLKVRYHRF